ncbi:zinc-dependent alcohol dehydrogenase family protein [uncultured Jatrophihabitans sp.]|uniref:zinc-dependent alcohol dehydrogenase family protein n=1 Tax=uncultured Jatrophihabitans sp. TaxID=1610747 RepID=UPI0035CA3619
MLAVRYSAFGQTPELVDVPAPHCPPDAVLVAVAATGLCRSDWHGWQGHDRDIVVPHVPGHEFAGVISAVGAEVTGWSVGERVTAPFVSACGRCPTCRRGDGQVCEAQTQPGFTHWGSFAEQVVVRNADVNLVALPDDMDFDTAAALGCRFATAYRAVVDRARAAPGDWVAVHGCGGVGLSAVMIAVAQGNRVVAVDTSAAARALAVELGAEQVLDPAQVEVASAIRDITGGGAAASLDALGSLPTLVGSVHCLRPRGTHVQIGLAAGVGPLPETVLAAAIAGELQLLGSHGMPARAYPAMLARIAGGELVPGRLVQRRISLSEAPGALAAMGTTQVGAGMTLIEVSAPGPTVRDAPAS